MRVTVISILLIIAHVLSSTIFGVIRIGGIIPNFMMMLIVSFALLRGSKEGAVIGIAAGLLYDISFGITVGPTALIYGVIGYICGKFNKNFYRENFILPFLCTLGATLCDGLYHTFIFLMQGEIEFVYFFKSIIIPEIIYTITLSLIIYQIAYLMNERIEESEKRTRNMF